MNSPHDPAEIADALRTLRAAGWIHSHSMNEATDTLVIHWTDLGRIRAAQLILMERELNNASEQAWTVVRSICDACPLEPPAQRLN